MSSVAFDFDSCLKPREAGQFVAERARFVDVCEAGVKKVANMIFDSLILSEDFNPFEKCELYPQSADQKTVEWCFFISTINFSFWTSSEHKFEVLYDGKKYTGFLSCCALVKKSLDMGIPLTDPRYILDIDFDRFRACFTNDEGDVIPMVDERWQNLRQVSSILCEKFNGTFYECLQQSDNSAQNLLKLVVENFPCYRDWATYEDTAVAFLKRAQILIGDIYNLLKGEPPAAFGDIDTLTTFADYRVPQVLVYFGALQYSDELQRLLNEGHVFSSGDVEEVEIRGCTVFAVDLVVDEVKRMLAEVNCKVVVSAIAIDYLLWNFRRRNADILYNIPYHKTRSIFY